MKDCMTVDILFPFRMLFFFILTDESRDMVLMNVCDNHDYLVKMSEYYWKKGDHKKAFSLKQKSYIKDDYIKRYKKMIENAKKS